MLDLKYSVDSLLDPSMGSVFVISGLDIKFSVSKLGGGAGKSPY